MWQESGFAQSATITANSQSPYYLDMLPLMLDIPDPMAELRQAGIDAHLCWNSDQDADAMVLVPADREGLDRYLQGRPRLALAA
jgi:hypothetical protein